MRLKTILVLAGLCELARGGERIPLDAINSKSFVIERDGPGKILPGLTGQDRPWRVKEESSFAKNAALDLPAEEDAWRHFLSVTEKTPNGSDHDPSQRVFNLPDLLDRVKLQGRLPKGLSLYSEDNRNLSLVVSAPTVISASFSSYRHVKIFNRSHLVLICPFCQQVELENTDNRARLEVYSQVCLKAPKKGKVKRYRLGDWLQPCTESTDVVPAGRLSQFAWLPQVLISQILGRTPSELIGYWNPMYRLGW